MNMEYDEDIVREAEEWRLRKLYEALDYAEMLQGKS